MLLHKVALCGAALVLVLWLWHFISMRMNDHTSWRSQQASSPQNPPPVCDSVVMELYSQPEAVYDEDDVTWCRTKQAAYRIIIGKSYGQAPKHMQREWENRHCNDLVTNNGQIRPCNDKFGWGYVDNFLATSSNILAVPQPPFEHVSVAGSDEHQHVGSRINCAVDIKNSLACGFHNVLVDFEKAPIVGIHREFRAGFVTAFGEQATSATHKPQIPGYLLQPLHDSPFSCDKGLIRDQGAARCANITAAEHVCDMFESRPTFVMSHDDIYNLAHHMNDVAMVWVMGILSGRPLSDSLFITMDGIRSGGPSGKRGHRLVDKHRPDNLSPFNSYYSSWFDEVRQGVSYGSRKVCFKEVYFQPFPGLAWVWGDWTKPSTCSMKASGGVHVPSPLFQSLNWQIRAAWRQSIGELPGPPASSDSVHIVVMSRGKSPPKQEGNIRVVANMAELVTAIKGIGASLGKVVTVTVQDFAVLSFEDQVRLAHSANIFVGMHGAALPHIFNAAIGDPNCCSLVEIFPEESKGFSTIQGFGNIARLLGMSYFRYVVHDGQSHKLDGSHVEMAKILPIIKNAVLSVSGRSICQHNVKLEHAPGRGVLLGTNREGSNNTRAIKFLSSVL